MIGSSKGRPRLPPPPCLRLSLESWSLGPVWSEEENHPICKASFVWQFDVGCEMCGEVTQFSGAVFPEEEGLTVRGSTNAATCSVYDAEIDGLVANISVSL